MVTDVAVSDDVVILAPPAPVGYNLQYHDIQYDCDSEPLLHLPQSPSLTLSLQENAERRVSLEQYAHQVVR